MRRKNVKLDRMERAIEKAAEEFKPVAGETRNQVDAILGAARKTRNINIRISESDLRLLKIRSQEEGLPYQTLITSILHKYLSHRLVDEEMMRKSLRLLRSEPIHEGHEEH